MPTPTVPALPLPVPGEMRDVGDDTSGRLAMYEANVGAASLGPMLLVHSVNAAASAYEVRPLFEHYAATGRPTYALDLPGYGHSDRAARPYTPRLMTDAVHLAIRAIQMRHGEQAVHVLAVSLGSEFAARACSEDPAAFRSLAVVSPTGLDSRRGRPGPSGSTREVPGLYRFLTFGLWDDALFRSLTKPRVIRYFLERTWGSKDIDEGLWSYDVVTTQQPGAKHAPLNFVSGKLFSADALAVYQELVLPVWASHGVRGDFVRYDALDSLLARPNWTRDVFQTGALPHFERRAEFIAAYDRFLTRSASDGG
ncbi:MAG: alpha/beta fold hydrolase [Myxococcales bacterium]|nr:alpha/beta fold hydrolase [Myxococcales bacterium]